jgi:hypothetical protein
MDTTGGGTAIMLAIAALLWFFYLVPTWLRRREYLATERTATRLQQTMRVLAETSELPDEVRVSATAREAARLERLLAAEQRRADAMAVREAAAVRRATPAAPRIAVAVAPGVLRRRRMRRTRRFASILMIGATLVALGQLWLITSSGMSAGAALVAAAAVAAGGVAIAVQRRLDVLAMPTVAAPTRSRAGVQVPSFETGAAPASWTPREVPKPMYLSRTEEPMVVTSRGDIQEALRAASADAERTLRAAQAAPEVVPLRSSPGSSRYAGMGVLGPDAVENADLDEILKRRRTAG